MSTKPGESNTAAIPRRNAKANKSPSENRRQSNKPASLDASLKKRLVQLPLPAFEEVIRELLEACGYGSIRMLGPGYKRGRAIGGHDVRAYNDTDLALSLTLAQIKRYEGAVPRRFVDELRGNALRLRAENVLLVTTSRFSGAATAAANAVDVPPITLINGEELISLLKEHLIGVRKTATSGSAALTIDVHYFTNLEDRFKSEDESHTHALKSPERQVQADDAIHGHDNTSCPGLHCPSCPTQLTPLTPSSNNTLSPSRINITGGHMQWRTHILAGVNSLWLLNLLPNGSSPDVFPLCLGLAAFGALMPDLDANESKIKHLAVAGIQPFALPAQAISQQFGHRGFLHSSSALVLVSVLSLPVAAYFGWQPWLALTLGYASHLAADACTVSGIPLRYIPWINPNKTHYHLLPRKLRFVTGSEAEGALLPFLALLALLLLLRQLPSSAETQTLLSQSERMQTPARQLGNRSVESGS